MPVYISLTSKFQVPICRVFSTLIDFACDGGFVSKRMFIKSNALDINRCPFLYFLLNVVMMEHFENCLLGTWVLSNLFQDIGFLIDRLVAGNALNCLFIESFQRYLGLGVTNFIGGTVRSCKQEGFVIDERGKLNRFSRKKLSRKRCKTQIKKLFYEAHYQIWSCMVINVWFLYRWLFEGARMEIWIRVCRWDFSCSESHCSKDSELHSERN